MNPLSSSSEKPGPLNLSFTSTGASELLVTTIASHEGEHPWNLALAHLASAGGFTSGMDGSQSHLS
jgi:hypothetical protein